MPMKKRVGRGGFIPKSDQVEEEPTVEIYITMETNQRLHGSATSWSNPVAYRAHPSGQFPVRMRAPKSALVHGVFDPTRCGGLAEVVAIAMKNELVHPPYNKK